MLGNYLPFAVGLAACLLVLVATRPRRNTGRAYAAVFAEVFTAVILGARAAQFVVLLLVQKL